MAEIATSTLSVLFCPLPDQTPYGKLRVGITDKLRSYTKPIKAIAPGANRRAHKGLTTGSKGHTDRRESGKNDGSVQITTLGVAISRRHDQINAIFRPRRYRLSALSYRHVKQSYPQGFGALGVKYVLNMCYGSFGVVIFL